MIAPPPVCINCKHFEANNLEGLTCKAFPKGIPEVILSGESKHQKPLKEQGNTIVYQPAEEK